jgi:hypothetical protein
MSSAQQTYSVFRHTGWNRIVIVVAVIYIIAVAFLVIREHSRINVFDQFDRFPLGYTFWAWSASAFLDTGEHRLVPRIGFISEVMFLPPIAFAFIVYSGLWIYQGFRVSRQPST